MLATTVVSLTRRRLLLGAAISTRQTTGQAAATRPVPASMSIAADQERFGLLFYNTACCESLAGQPDQAVAHLARAIELWNGCAVWRRRVLRDRYASSAREEAASRSASSTRRPSGGRGGRRRRNGSGTRGRTRCESSGSTRTSSGLMRGRSSTQAPTPLAAGVMPPLSACPHRRKTPRPRDRLTIPRGLKTSRPTGYRRGRARRTPGCRSPRCLRLRSCTTIGHRHTPCARRTGDPAPSCRPSSSSRRA